MKKVILSALISILSLDVLAQNPSESAKIRDQKKSDLEQKFAKSSKQEHFLALENSDFDTNAQSNKMPSPHFEKWSNLSLKEKDSVKKHHEDLRKGDLKDANVEKKAAKKIEPTKPQN